MDQWNTLAHLPSFWAQEWPWVLTIAAAAIGLLCWLPGVVGRERARDARATYASTACGEDFVEREATKADHVSAFYTAYVIIILTVFGFGALHSAHNTTRGHAIADQVVSYVESTTNLTALSPVELAGSSGQFDAVRPDGTIVHVTVTWLPLDTRPYRTGAHLPANVKPFTVDIHDKTTS